MGDRQFWVTRPYEWKQLLAAKALFVLVWVYVPFLLMQAAIVKLAGFSPLAHADGWIHCLVLVTGCILLPLIVIAAITENFARMTLTLFGGVVALIVGAYLTFSPSHGYEATTPYDHRVWIIGVLIAGALVAIPLQYAMRRVWLARAVAIGTVVLATGMGITLTALRDGQISRLYRASGTAPLQLSLATERKIMRIVPSERPGMAYLEMSLDFSGVAADRVVQVDDVKATLDDASSGWHSTTPWWSSETLHILPGTHHGQVEIMLPREQLERFLANSATLQLTLATTELQAGNGVTGGDPFCRQLLDRGFRHLLHALVEPLQHTINLPRAAGSAAAHACRRDLVPEGLLRRGVDAECAADRGDVEWDGLRRFVRVLFQLAGVWSISSATATGEPLSNWPRRLRLVPHGRLRSVSRRRGALYAICGYGSHAGLDCNSAFVLRGSGTRSCT